ncbi:signal peptidase I [soil metagenome]
MKHMKDHDLVAAAQSQRKKSDDGFWETIKVIVQALLIAFAVRMFLYQPFNIPSGSMYPTLKVGDYLFVSKLSYGYSKYSFNFGLSLFGLDFFKVGPFPFNGRVFLAKPPSRGDVAVFKVPKDNETDYIKRVIGLPGDHIQMQEGVLYINGTAVPKVRVEDYVDQTGEGLGKPVPQYRETLPNGVTYNVLDRDPNGSGDNTQEYIVPPDHFFMMGDNRDNSADSRWANDVGYVPYENFVGRADIIFFSIEPDAAFWEVWKWPLSIRWSRFLNFVN